MENLQPADDLTIFSRRQIWSANGELRRLLRHDANPQVAIGLQPSEGLRDFLGVIDRGWNPENCYFFEISAETMDMKDMKKTCMDWI